jgi:hypothetical protein
MREREGERPQRGALFAARPACPPHIRAWTKRCPPGTVRSGSFATVPVTVAGSANDTRT